MKKNIKALDGIQKQKMNDEWFWISMFDRILILGSLPQANLTAIAEEDVPTIASLSKKLEPTPEEIKKFEFGLNDNKFLTMNEKGYEELFNPCLTDVEKLLIQTSLEAKRDWEDDEDTASQIKYILDKFYN